MGTAVHEIGHALGLWHEQSRGDRDRFIAVRLDKVAPENQHNFDKHIDEERKFRGLMTKALIEGLNGAPGAIDANNNITSASLAHFVEKRVEALARDAQVQQAVDKPKPPATEIVFYRLTDDKISKIRLGLIVGPETAGKQIIMLNLRTSKMVTSPGASKGARLEFEIEGNAHYQLIVPGRQPVVVDPAELAAEPADVPLP